MGSPKFYDTGKILSQPSKSRHYSLELNVDLKCAQLSRLGKIIWQQSSDRVFGNSQLIIFNAIYWAPATSTDKLKTADEHIVYKINS